MKVKEVVRTLQVLGVVGDNEGVKLKQSRTCMELMNKIEEDVPEITEIIKLNNLQEPTDEDKEKYNELNEEEVEYEKQDLILDNDWVITASQLNVLKTLINIDYA